MMARFSRHTVLIFFGLALLGCVRTATPPATPTLRATAVPLSQVTPSLTPRPSATPQIVWATPSPRPEPTAWAEPCPETAVIVALDGDDTAPGTLSQPLASLEAASQRVQPGGTICVRGGVYTAVQDKVNAKGMAEQPIVVRPYEGESVVFDGTGAAIEPTGSIINLSGAAHVIFEGFEVRNSTGRGISIYEGDHVTVRHNRVHEIWTRAIGGGGQNLTIEDNEVWNAVLENENNAYNATGGWAAGISTWTREDGSPSRDIIIRNNYVHDVWGEGIMALRADGVLVEGNTVHDVYSVNLYINKVQNGIFRNNYLYVTTDKYNRSDRSYPAHGINIANENARGDLPRSNHLLIANNLIIGTGNGIRYWHDERGNFEGNNYQDIQIVNNVIMETVLEAIYFDKIPAEWNPPTNAALHNNIIFAGKNGEALFLGNREAWTISHNNWPDGIPDTADEPHSLSAPPLFVNPVVGGPPTGFMLQAGSSSIGAGVPLSDVLSDFRGFGRSATPSLGIFE